MRNVISYLLILAALPGLVWAETISGTVLIKKRLTKRKVTTPVSIYQRGTAVEPAAEPVNPLDYERSHVAVWIEGLPHVPAQAKLEASIVQEGRRFTPDLVIVAAGSSVAFPNMDPIFHNVFSLSRLKSFDLGFYPKGDSRSVTFDKPGVVSVNCRLHPDMAATVVVTPNGWFTRVEPGGAFKIPDIPPGAYSVVAWHKAAGYFRQTVQLAPGAGAEICFFIPVDEEP